MPPKAAAATPHDPTTGEILEDDKALVASNTGTDLVPEDFDYGDDIGAGFENQTGADVSIPFLVVLQPGSPEIQGEDAVAKAGQIINKTTGDVYSGRDGFTFIPAVTQHLMVEWIPRNSGGGLVAQHAIDSDLARRVRASQPLGAYRHPDNGNDLIETFYVYGAAVDPAGALFPAVMAFSSTHIKPYQDWMFKARSIVYPLPNGRKLTNLPLFAHGYQITTKRMDKNGNTWYIPQAAFAGGSAAESRLSPTDERYIAAKSVREAVNSGALRADTDSLKQETADTQPSRGSRDSEQAPY